MMVYGRMFVNSCSKGKDSQVLSSPFKVVLIDQRRPAMHRAMGWCKLGVLIKWLSWTYTGFKALRAGRT
jgi:hypothetical protein